MGEPTTTNHRTRVNSSPYIRKGLGDGGVNHLGPAVGLRAGRAVRDVVVVDAAPVAALPRPRLLVLEESRLVNLPPVQHRQGTQKHTARQSVVARNNKIDARERRLILPSISRRPKVQIGLGIVRFRCTSAPQERAGVAGEVISICCVVVALPWSTNLPGWLVAGNTTALRRS